MHQVVWDDSGKNSRTSPDWNDDAFLKWYQTWRPETPSGPLLAAGWDWEGGNNINFLETKISSVVTNYGAPNFSDPLVGQEVKMTGHYLFNR